MALEVLLHLQVFLEIHQPARHRVDVGQDAVNVVAKRAAEGAEGLDAVVGEQDLEPVALQLVGGRDELARVEHGGDLKAQVTALGVVDGEHLLAGGVAVVALLALSEEVAQVRTPIRMVFQLSKDSYWVLTLNSLSIVNILEYCCDSRLSKY